jgi:hypothetical protein
MRHPDLDWRWYVPAWRGNRAAFERGTESAPMRLELRPPTVRDAEALADTMTAGTPSRDAEVAYIRTHLRQIENFEWSDGTPIRTAEEFLARRDRLDPELWREITLAALNLGRLEEGLVGKSDSPSASPRSRSAIVGTVENVAQPA